MTYLLELLGVPLVPTRASFSVVVGIYPTCRAVGTLGSLSPTAIGIDALTGAVDSLVLPAALVVASVYAEVSSFQALRASKLSLMSAIASSQYCHMVRSIIVDIYYGLGSSQSRLVQLSLAESHGCDAESHG